MNCRMVKLKKIILMQSFSIFYLLSFLLSPSYPSSFNILYYANSISLCLLVFLAYWERGDLKRNVTFSPYFFTWPLVSGYAVNRINGAEDNIANSLFL